uniref:Myb/SANT-like domain-containing protein n=1 Tax=Aegilops tauschii subsp. strangulata TaxID=200361 RepID=A0A453EKJ0_AEGTS
MSASSGSLLCFDYTECLSWAPLHRRDRALLPLQSPAGHRPTTLLRPLRPSPSTAALREMDNTEVTAASGNSAKSGVIVWTPAMTNMMLGFLADLVAKGKRTSSGFREAHHRQCAAVLNEQFKLAVTGEQVRNHLKKWRKIWGRVVILKNLSGALWDENT